jgi:hypothetical protein
LWEGGVQNFRIADQQALCSLIAFNLGAVVGRIGDKVGAQKRIWLFASTFIQALFTMAGAIAFWKSGQPSIADERDHPAWSNVLSFVGLAFISASLGLQGVLGKRLNTAFGTTSTLLPRFQSDVLHLFADRPPSASASAVDRYPLRPSSDLCF